MNKQEFLNEAKEYVEACFEQFKEYQENVNDVLDAFHDLCKKNGLHYYVAYGSLLGLIRDGGDIPWDYDIDVLVPINEREKLLNVLDSNLPDEYYYAYYNNMSDYPAECLRVCRKGDSYMALHLDVYFYIGAPDEKDKRDKLIQKVRKLSVKRAGKFCRRHVEREKTCSKSSKVSAIVNKVRFAFVTNQRLINTEKRLCKLYPLGTTGKCIVLDDVNDVFNYSCLGEGKDQRFGTRVRTVPENSDDYLTDTFGDYKKYFPIKNRFEEFYNMKNIVDQRQKYYREHQMKK